MIGEDILKIAKLAKIELSPEEALAFDAQLSKFLSHVDKLLSTDTTSVEDLMASLLFPWQEGGSTREAQDIPLEKAGSDILINAPKATGTAFEVPKFVDG